MAAADEQDLLVPHHHGADTDGKVTEEGEPAFAVRAGQPIAAALVANVQLLAAPGTELHTLPPETARQRSRWPARAMAAAPVL